MGALPRSAKCVIGVLPGVLAYLVIACSSTGGTGNEQSPPPTSDGGDATVDTRSSSPDGGRPDDGSAAIPDGDSATVPQNACFLSPTVNCTGNTVGYLCTGNARLGVKGCSGGLAEPNGYGFCCTLPASMSTCKLDPAAACAGAAIGYTCTGSDTPAQSSTSLICLTNMAQGGVTSHCCATYVSTSCQLTTALTNCGGAYGFSCSGGLNPAQAQQPDAGFLLMCSTGSSALNSMTDYCCVFSPPITSPTCVVDPTVPCTPTTGYSCRGSDTPSQDYPGLTCGTPAQRSGMTSYCCRDN